MRIGPVARALALISAIAIAQHARAQPRPAIADPFHAHLVTGRVVGPDGAPLASVVVERVVGPRDATPYSRGAYRVVTDATGAFRFSFRGIGTSTGLEWHLAVRRPGCAVEVRTVHLTRRVVPGVGREGDVATDLELRVPACPSP